MKETTALNRIDKIIENMNYKTAYIEIQTNENKYILEKEKHNPIGFRSNLNEH